MKVPAFHLYSEHVFDWGNYLYACSPCNGPQKNRFAVIASNGSIVDVTRKRNRPIRPPVKGHPVLLHPRIENPLEFMMLDILGDTFLFVPSAVAQLQAFERAPYTIHLLRLNQRDHLLARSSASNRQGVSPAFLALGRVKRKYGSAA